MTTTNRALPPQASDYVDKGYQDYECEWPSHKAYDKGPSDACCRERPAPFELVSWPPIDDPRDLPHFLCRKHGEALTNRLNEEDYNK